MVAKKKKVEKKEIFRFCFHCGDNMTEDDDHVILATIKNGEIREECFFHFICWKDYFEQKVKAKAESMQTASSSMSNIGKNFDVIKMIPSMMKMIPKEFHNPKVIMKILNEYGTPIKKNKEDGTKTKTKSRGKKSRRSKSTKKKKL